MPDSVSPVPSVPSMDIEIRDISTVCPYEKNSRLNDKAVDTDGVIIGRRRKNWGSPGFPLIFRRSWFALIRRPFLSCIS